MSDTKPKWSKWKLFDDAKVWEVVALSLDIDPDKVKRDRNDWMAGGSFVNHEGVEFQDRLDVINANYRKIDATPKTLSTNGIAYCDLNISKFAKWAMSVNWEIPKELKQLATTTDEIDQQSENQKLVIEKPLSTRTENNYLRLILTLANNIKGFNPKKPYEAAQLIINETEIKISQQTISEYIKKAYEIESQNRE